MFIGFSKNLGGGFRISIGEHFNLQPSKTEQKRNEFLSKVRLSAKEIANNMLTQTNINYDIFEYAIRSETNIDLKPILSANNYVISENVFEQLTKVGEYLEKAEYAETLTSSTKEKITNILFQAKQDSQKATREEFAEDKILEQIAQANNKPKNKMKKIIIKQAKKMKRTKKPSRLKFVLKLLAVIIAISLLVSYFDDQPTLPETQQNNMQQSLK